MIDSQDYLWNSQTGQVTLQGDLLRLFRGLDREIVKLSRKVAAREMKFPIFLPSFELSKLDYFKSFPHLITFPVTLDPDEENLSQFAAQNHSRAVHLTKTSAIQEVLTPAACYHFYVALQGSSFDEAQFLTTMCPCFRREKLYEPLRRQWAFSMREIVILGTGPDVEDFLADWEKEIPEFAKSLGLSFEWTLATDPFFKPLEDPKYFAQVVSPTKREMIFEKELSIGSLNNHRSYFGETFQLNVKRAVASSACLAFGLERWIFAILKTHGTQSKDWPASVKELLYDGL